VRPWPATSVTADNEETIAVIGEKIEELKGQERVLEGQIGQLG
jgi:hypothetical protein